MNWTKSADSIIKSGSDLAWYDRPIRPEKRISKLEHELGVNCNPCSDELCHTCDPDRQIRVGGVYTTIREMYDRQIAMNLREAQYDKC